MEIGEDGHEVLSPGPLLRVEEQVSVAAVRRLAARIEVSTRTETVEDLVSQVLTASKVDVSRHPRNQWIAGDTAVPITRTEGSVTIVPVLEERLFVEKRLFLVEEIHIRQTDTADTASIPVTLRKMRVEISRTEPDSAPS